MFAWEKPVKIEKIDRHTRRISVVQTTPLSVISEPNGHRPEDITNSLCIVVAEIARTLTVQGQSAMKIQSMLEQSVKESKSAERKEAAPEKPKRKYNRKKRTAKADH